MIDYFLRFPVRDLAQLPESLRSDGALIHATHQYALCEVGEIPGREGWHLNIRVIDEAFDMTWAAPFLVHPQQPKVVWA